MAKNLTGELKSLLVTAATDFPTQPAIISPGRTLNYRQYVCSVSTFAKRLGETNLEPGSHVAIVAENSVEYIVALMGIMQTELIACPISSGVPDSRLKELLTANNVSLVIADQNNVSRISSLTSLDIIVLEEIITRHRDLILPEDKLISTDKPAFIIQTSGSSKNSKSAVLSFGNLYYNALGSNQNISIAPGDRWLLSLPLYHVGGLGILFRTLLSGAAVVLPNSKLSLAQSIESHKVTHLSLVATQLFRLLKDTKNHNEFASLKAILLGGGPVSVGLIKQTAERGWPLYYSYGLTEMASQVTTSRQTNKASDASEPVASGTLLPYRQLRIGLNGEIEVNGETRFAGYYQPGKIVSDFDENGWFKTGDIGYLDENSRLIVTGRRDNQFISGGENIQPEEIEAVLCRWPDIETAVVVPVPSEEFGFRPVAFIKNQAGNIDLNELKTKLSESIPKFMVPDRLYPWPDESTRSGLKPNRHQLIRLAEQLIKDKI